MDKELHNSKSVVRYCPECGIPLKQIKEGFYCVSCPFLDHKIPDRFLPVPSNVKVPRRYAMMLWRKKSPGQARVLKYSRKKIAILFGAAITITIAVLVNYPF